MWATPFSRFYEFVVRTFVICGLLAVLMECLQNKNATELDLEDIGAKEVIIIIIMFALW